MKTVFVLFGGVLLLEWLLQSSTTAAGVRPGGAGGGGPSAPPAGGHMKPCTAADGSSFLWPNTWPCPNVDSAEGPLDNYDWVYYN